jgi:hypothetical protein
MAGRGQIIEICEARSRANERLELSAGMLRRKAADLVVAMVIKFENAPNDPQLSPIKHFILSVAHDYRTAAEALDVNRDLITQDTNNITSELGLKLRDELLVYSFDVGYMMGTMDEEGYYQPEGDYLFQMTTELIWVLTGNGRPEFRTIFEEIIKSHYLVIDTTLIELNPRQIGWYLHEHILGRGIVGKDAEEVADRVKQYDELFEAIIAKIKLGYSNGRIAIQELARMGSPEVS